MAAHIMIRDTNSQEHGVFSTLLTASGQRFQTVEQQWNDNKPFESCVPAGIYTIRKVNSPTFGWTFALEGHDYGVAVTKKEVNKHDHLTRYACLFHSANVASELKGCVAPGTKRWYYKEKWAVKHSQIALEQILEEFEDGDTLVIEWESIYI